jgi:hypothetical protein
MEKRIGPESPLFCPREGFEIRELLIGGPFRVSPAEAFLDDFPTERPAVRKGHCPANMPVWVSRNDSNHDVAVRDHKPREAFRLDGKRLSFAWACDIIQAYFPLLTALQDRDLVSRGDPDDLP